METEEEIKSSEGGTDKNLPKKAIEVTEKDVVLLINQLKNPSSKVVFSSLNCIRTKVIMSGAGISLLHECGGFKYLVKLLSVSAEREILCITLSILGNCCSRLVSHQDLREEFAFQVCKHDIAPRVVSILRKVTSESIQKRVCRLIGNLAQAHNLARELHRANVTLAIIPVLNTTNSSQVKQMAVRALRWLWEADKYHGDMLKAGAVKCVANLLDTKDKELIPIVLRALVVFSQPCSLTTAEQMRGNGSGYMQIVSMMNLPVVSVLICNLSQSPAARVELSKVGVVPSIIKKLEGGKIDSYLIVALCLMCRESMVRASLRTTSQGFETLLALLSNRRARTFHPEVLNAVTQFNYDQQSLMMMVRAGLIETLVEKLAEFVQAHGCQHEETTEAVEMAPVSPSRSWSPPSDIAHNHMLYSPTCSSPESSQDEDSIPSLENSASYTEGPTGEDGCILEVLSQLTYQNIPLPPLGAKVTITTFLDYLVSLRYPQNRHNYLKASKTLCAIVSCKHYYDSLLDDESVLAIHRELCRARHTECSHCQRLQETGRTVLGDAMLAAQSGLGEGEMSYRLAMASDHVKASVALTIPHVVRQPNLLYNLLFCRNAFQCLLESLDTRIDEAVPALHQLFTTLGIRNPQILTQTCTHCDIANMRKEANVSFSLDDGSTVTANKESLSHNCPMFEAMFRGGFKESQQATVRLTDISSDCLTHFTRLADEYCQCVLPKELSTLLEMVTVTDRFLLPELTHKIVGYLMNTALSHSTCPDIYDWGVRIGYKLPVTAEVASEAVRHLLAADMSCPHRVEATARILAGPNKRHFIEDLTHIVRTGLLSYAKNFRFLQRN